MKKIIFNEQEIQNIITLYNQGNTLKAIGENFNVSRGVIKRILVEQNTILRQTTPKYQANYNVFEIINSPEKAYWLGFIAADGCNYQREHNASIIISIHQKDLNHLYKFQSFCNTNAPIKLFEQDWGYSNKTPMCKITLNSLKMSNDLIDKGIVPNKSLILKPPKISEEYYLPFILGYFDGDGSIAQLNQLHNFALSIQGTKEFLTWVNELLQISSKLEKRNDDTKNSYYIRCGGTNKPYNILRLLYNSCETHLDRKYLIYKNLETVVFNRNIK